jgi:hypothetical protein
MELTQTEQGLLLVAQGYRLTWPADRPFVYLDDAAGARVAELFMLSSVHALGGRDDTTAVEAWQVEQGAEETLVSLRASSSLWAAKTYRLRCRERRLIYEIEVEGAGQLAEVNYFGGYCSCHLRWGSGFFWSGQRFERGFNPEPNSSEVNYFPPTAHSVIDMTGVPLPGRRDFYFTPPPFCYAFQLEGGAQWLSMGVEARPGAQRFTEYHYHGQFGFHLSLSYEGHTAVAGRYQLPSIGFDFADDELKALAAHVAALRALGSAPPGNVAGRAAWWSAPIFCGWGQQCHLANVEGGRAPEYARQERYEEFLATLERHDVAPGIVVLDDKWQATYGENSVDQQKWPDLRGFIARQHARGRKVLLWLKAWDPEGLPPEECIVNAAGLPVALDPTSPALERRLRAAVRRMLGPDGYDADGFKIDFTARIPSGPGMRLAGDSWGLELMRRYLGLLYDEAKRAKPDSLIMAHTPNPYLSDVVDMIRLNDMVDLQLLDEGVVGRQTNAVMTLRARIAAIACPDALIDTDNWAVMDKATWRDYVSLQPDLGVPSLYFTTHIDVSGEPLEEEDYALIREAWARARQQVPGS